MPIPYICFGDNAIVDPVTGKLNSTQLSNDKWTVVALLGWDSIANTYTPALLVRTENQVLNKLLELLNAKPDDDQPVTAAVPNGWRLLRFKNMLLTPAGGVTADLADAQDSHAFLIHKTTQTVTVESSSAFSIAGVVNVAKVTATVTANTTTPLAEFSIHIQVQNIDLRSVGFKSPFTINKPIMLAYSTADGKLTVNGTDLSTISDTGSTHLPLNPDAAVSVEAGSSGERRIGFEIVVPNGTYTHRPLISGIPGSLVTFDWKQFRIRLHDDQIGFAAAPGSEDLLGTATFQLPLIQAAVGAETTNALAKLVPSTAEALTPLKYKVNIHRPKATLDVAPLLWTVKRTGDALADAGQFVEEIGKEVLAVFAEDSNDQDADLNSFFAPLQELAGKAGEALSFSISQVKTALDGQDGLISAITKLDAFNTDDYPLPLALKVGKDKTKPDFVFLIVLRINLWEGRLSKKSNNRAYFYVASGTGSTAAKPQMLDLTSFAVTLPVRTKDELMAILTGTDNPLPKKGLPDASQHDGYLDFEALDVVLDVQPVSQPNRPQMAVLFPGGLKKDDGSVENAEEEKRLRILLEDFDPQTWPEPVKDKSTTLQLRLGARGLTFSALADTVKEAKIKVIENSSVPLRLVESRDGLRSGLVVIDNQVRYANLAGRIKVPGLDNFEADVSLGLRRDQPQGPPVVTAVIDIDRTDRKPLARMKVSVLKAQLDDLRMQLTWKSDKSDWDFRAWATGAISITGDIGSTGGIEGLDQPRAIPFRDLDLTRLHKDEGQIPLGRPVGQDNGTTNGPVNGTPSTIDQVARFELLEKQFRIEFYNSVLYWDLPEKTARFEIERARFEYQSSSGDLDVAIEAGKIKLMFDLNTRSLKFETPSSFGLQVRIGTQLSFAGNVGWEDTPTEHYFRADGRLQMTGFPEVAGSLKLGTGLKDDGKTAPNLAIFAELPYEADLFSGVVLKRVGLGLGLNNRLAGIGDRPDPRAILANLDRIDPKQSRNWSFVSDAGVYVSVVATAMIASNRGKDDVVCAYVAKLLLSIDTNIDIVAAAQVWLFSSPGYITQKDHERRPTLIGAAVLSAREKNFSLVAQTTPRPAIESNQMLADLLSRVRARFSFYLSSDLADFYLEELSYRDQMFGINVVVSGSYRIAIGRFGALMRATLGLRGELPEKKLEGGIGGFSFRGKFGLDADFGGLVSSRGLAAYGSIRAGLSFRVSAFVNIPSVAWETIEYEETLSITVSIPYLKCKRWKCKWKTREIRESVTVRIKLVYPVFSVEEYHLPESSLDLFLEGLLAFDESGGIGFSGSIAISISVCGHQLRIAPRFDYRPEVATNVRRRVAAVEDQLNRLRGIPRPPVQNLPANEGENLPSVETWYYYKSVNGDKVYHLLVPSSEYAQWWYTPHASDMSQYANLPRDTAADDNGQIAASSLEKRHLSPFRNAVMRMVLPFKDDSNEIKQVVDLAMPWDRGNYDSLPGEENDQKLIDLVMQLTQIESAFLNTAAKAKSLEKEPDDWGAQEEPGLPLTNVEIVSDPRPESSARVYWTLTDQMMRPDGIYPYRYRPVQELVSQGFDGVSRRGDIGRLLRFEQVSRRAVVQGRYADAAPSAARRLKNTRASLLSTILADLTRERGPERYKPIDEIKLVRKDEDNDKTPVVTRRRAVISVLPDDGQTPNGDGVLAYTLKLTYAILDNSTDLNLEPGLGDTHVDLKIQLPDGTEVDLKIEYSDSTAPNYVNLTSLDPAPLATRHKALFTQPLSSKPLETISLQISRNGTKTWVLFELQTSDVKTALQPSQVGLFAVTDVKDELTLDLTRTRIIRNEENSDLDENNSVSWSRNRPIRIIPMNDDGGVADPIEAIQRWVRCLPPCQEFLSADQDVETIGETDAEGRVRVRLPVKFDEQLLKAELPRLNGFEIYRRFPWDPQPVKIAEGVPPVLRRVDDNGRTVLLVESFLFGEDFVFNRDTGRFTGVASAVIPGVTPIEYSLLAVPFGRPPTVVRPTFRRWPAVTLHVPPMQKQLPPLGIVVPVENLFLKQRASDGTIPKSDILFELVDSRHATWDWPDNSWDELEIWAEAQRIRSSGSYAVEGEVQETDPLAAARQTVREPDDLTVERIPESVSGKILVARLQRPSSSTEMTDWTLVAGTAELKDGLKVLQPGFGYRFFIRPTVNTQAPLVQPLAMYLIRQLPPRMDEATPVLHVDRLELVENAEVNRVFNPVAKVSGTPLQDAWVPAAGFHIIRRTEVEDPFERLRLAWDHLSDLDAGVEILLQDVDEPHRVDRQLVTAQEEAVFQMAIQDFRNPSLWRAFPNPESFERVWDDNLTGVTPSQDLTSMILWGHERNPAIDRVRKTRLEFTTQLEPYKTAPSNNDNWMALHPSMADYIAALLAYQRTPLAPATTEDREGLDLLINLSQAMLLGVRIPTDKNPLPSNDDETDVKTRKLSALRMALDEQEQQIRRLLSEIESIDLSKMEVNDTPAAYGRLKLQLHNIDIAKQLAGIAARRLAAAEDLLDLSSADDLPPGGNLPERLPQFTQWQTLVSRYREVFEVSFTGFTSVQSPDGIEMTTPKPHGLLDGELIEIEGVTGLNDRQFSVSLLSPPEPKKFLLLDVDPTGLTSSAGLIVRQAGQQSRQLLEMFEDRATGQTAAVTLGALLSLIRDPSAQLTGDAPDELYRKEVAKLVPLVSGVVAGLDALKADAQANNWTLVRRAHHHLAIEETGNGRKAVKEPISLYLPDAIGGPNPRDDRPNLNEEQIKALNDDDLIIPFVNLLERLGCAVDLAVVDALNQPLPQARLLEWIGNQAWSAILGTVKGTETKIPHEVVLVTGREPDTDRESMPLEGNMPRHQDEDQSLGYAFVKLVVVPRSLVSDILNKHNVLQTWFDYRSLWHGVDPDQQVTAKELEAVRKMAAAWWMSISRLPGTDGQQPIGHCIVETRGRRWATVPVLGGRAHIDWEASDAAGRLLQVAIRRVSRYEGLLRWARGKAVPMLPRIHGLTTAETQTVSLRRRMVANEEPESLPVLISPHPTRIEFVYALPTSGARATVSGLSARRTGYQGITAQFSHKRIDGPSGLGENGVNNLIGAISTLNSFVKIKVEEKTSATEWKIDVTNLTSGGTALTSGDTVVVIDQNQEHARAAESILNQTNNTWTLRFSAAETDDFATPVTGAFELDGLVDPLNRPVTQNQILGQVRTISQASGTKYRLTLAADSVALSEDSAAYIGQLLITDPPNSQTRTFARVVTACDIHNQSLTLDKPLPDGVHKVRILTGVATGHRTTIVRNDAGVPGLFRHERLISLSNQPYFRKYAVHVGPQYDAVQLSATPATNNEPTFADRRPSVLAVHQPWMRSSGTSPPTYSFRLLLTRQGDLLTPAELLVDRELDMAESKDSAPDLLTRRKLPAGELPDLNCTYQILWELPDSSQSDPIYAELVEVVLPGSPQWLTPDNAVPAEDTPVFIQNRNGTAIELNAVHVPIQLWWPTKEARPVYVVTFDVQVKPAGLPLFENNDNAWLQMQRDGYRSRPVKIMNSNLQ